MRKVKGYAAVMVSAVLYGLMPFGTRIVNAEGVTALTVCFFRCIVSCPIMLLCCMSKGEKHIFPEKKQIIPLAIASLMGEVLTPILLLNSYNFIDTGLATVLHFIYPALVIVICCIFLHSKVSWRKLLCVIMNLGSIMLLNISERASGLNLGIVLAVLSGCAFAIYVALLGTAPFKPLSGEKQCFWLAFFSVVYLTIFTLRTGGLHFPESKIGWLTFVLLVVMTGAVAHLLFQTGIKIIGSENASLLSTLEPLTSVIMGIIAFHEKLSIGSAIGSILIILSIIITIKDD